MRFICLAGAVRRRSIDAFCIRTEYQEFLTKICEGLLAASGVRILGVGVAAEPKSKTLAARSNGKQYANATIACDAK